MRTLIKTLLMLAAIVVLAAAGTLGYSSVTRAHAAAVVAQAASAQPARMGDIGSTRSLEIIPLLEAVSSRSDLQALHGVSYLIRTDGATILLDIGPGVNGQPLPSIGNLQKLGLSLDQVDAVVISHNHGDHTGATGTPVQALCLGNPPVDFGTRSIFVPRPLHSVTGKVVIAENPQKLAPGVATLGALPFVEPSPMELLGDAVNSEQALAVNVEGSGIVLITGCGHPGVDRLVARSQALFDQPVVGLVGGLHLTNAGAKDLQPLIASLLALHPQILALSPHDSFEPARAAMRQALPEAYRDMSVGQRLRVR